MTIHIDEVEFYLEHVDPNGTAEEVARWMGANRSTLRIMVRRMGRGDLVDRMSRNSLRRGFNVQIKDAS